MRIAISDMRQELFRGLRLESDKLGKALKHFLDVQIPYVIGEEKYLLFFATSTLPLLSHHADGLLGLFIAHLQTWAYPAQNFATRCWPDGFQISA